MIRRHTALLLCLFTCSPLLRAANEFGYTEERPLVIVSDWDFHPFEFIDIHGNPSGYNVEVLDIILNKLSIPHKFLMEDWHVATEMFKNHEADLIHALYFFFKDAPYVSTRNYINYYNLKVARRADMPPLNQLSKLKPTDKLLVKEDDYAPMSIALRDQLKINTEFFSPKNALTGIRQGKYKYFIWGEIPLSHKIQELGLDSIVLDEIDIPAGELRIIGYNKDLIDIIDDQYTRLEQAGELQKVYDHWFHPEREHDDASPIALLIIIGLLVAGIVVSLLMWLVRKRVGIAVRQSADLMQMMDQVLNMGDYFVVEWDFKSNMLRNKYGKMLPNGDMKPEEFLTRMPEEEAKKLHSLNVQIAKGVITHLDINIHFNQGTHEHPNWRSYYGNGIVEMANGKPRYIVYTTKDITDEENENRRIKTVTNKYKKMFDTNLIAMSFYDAKGNLLDLNKKMAEVCQIDANSELFFRSTSLFNFPNLKGVYLPGSREIFHVCQHLHEPQFGLDKYVEFRIQPAMNDEGELVYYIVTARDITAERNMYIGQLEHDRQLHATNNAIKRYGLQLSYLLEESKMYIWNYRPSENVINITRSPGQTEFCETIEDYLRTINVDARQKALEEIQNVMQDGKPYNTILPFDRTPLDDEPSWYSISGIPIFDKDGQLTEFSGLSRNSTNLLQAQEKLRVETLRAEDSGRLKAAFLANMTHEIRTPLNAIVGFSDLLPMVDTKQEKQEFIRIIRNNCDMLLRLINDILEASNIESRPMAIELTDVDFAQVFDDICQTLEQRVQEPGVEFIKDNPYSSLPARLDKGRIQQVVTNFVTNAVKYTHEGHIRVGYIKTPLGEECLEKRNDNTSSADLPSQEHKHAEPLLLALQPSLPQEPGILLYCEDTGAGIPKEKQSAVFDRFVKLDEFVQGTGLGLSISKAIANRLGGKIGVSSEGEGKGSTFWFWTPL